MFSQLSDRLNIIVPAVLLGVLFFLPQYTSPSVAANILLLIIFAIGYNLLLGYGKEISLGHGGLLGVGTYTTTLFLIHGSPNVILAVCFGILATLLAGTVFGVISLYSRGIVFAMITLALGQIVFFLAYAFSETLGGGTGLYFPNEVSGVVFGFDLFNQSQLFLITYVLMALSLFASYRIINSPFGRILIAIGDNEKRAEYIGYNTDRHLLVAFVFSAGFAGLAGSLQALLFFGASPSVLQVQQSLEVLLGTIIGGAGTVGGPFVGMALFELAKVFLTEQTDHYPLLFGMMFVLLTYFFKGGITTQYMKLVEYIQE